MEDRQRSFRQRLLEGTWLGKFPDHEDAVAQASAAEVSPVTDSLQVANLIAQTGVSEDIYSAVFN